MPHIVHATAAEHLEAGETRPDGVTLAAFAGVALIGGGNAVAIKIGLHELAPFWGAAIRFLSASVILLVFVAATRRPIPGGRALAGVLIYGALSFGGSYAFAYYALTEVTAGTGMVTLALVPLFTVLLAAAQRIEEFRVNRLAGA
ncbi:MAG TPA: DMT family transporter, partial [Devosiaceae bacterium]|nr:DMT family transporter [Devosiaceae bacterium]